MLTTTQSVGGGGAFFIKKNSFPVEHTGEFAKSSEAAPCPALVGQLVPEGLCHALLDSFVVPDLVLHLVQLVAEHAAALRLEEVDQRLGVPDDLRMSLGECPSLLWWQRGSVTLHCTSSVRPYIAAHRSPGPLQQEGVIMA